MVIYPTTMQHHAPPQQQQIAAELPWGAIKLLAPSVLDPSIHPGHFAAQSLIVDFIAIADRKLSVAVNEPLDKHLTKSFRREEDQHFDNVLRALNGVSEHCLPSVLRAVCLWYEQQLQKCFAMLHNKRPNIDVKGVIIKGEQDYKIEKRVLAVDFIFCLVLIEILPQLYLHPGHDEQIQFIIQQAFKQFRYKDPTTVGANLSNAHIIADLYAEVVGVLAQARFSAVRRRFTAELTELRHEKDGGPLTALNIVALLMGMKFVRVKTNNLDELEQGISFLHELGVYFLEVKDRESNRDVKHHIAGLLVEILLPLGAQVKTETNVPTLINFVELLYSHTLDLASKKRHQLAAFPLLTCLLCISQSKFFLNNWHQFLTLTLSNFKNRDVKLSRVALESLYRLLWVYVIRIGCESNTATHSRLQSICSSLFPRGGRGIIPREAPLNIFVKIIHFIAQGKLDFAFKEIIFDLLCVNRPVRTVYPERMNVGLRALMVIADGLQQKEGPPGLPRSMGPVASGTIQRIKKTYLTRPLTADVARNIGLDAYYGPCRRAFDGILRALDRDIGRPLMSNVVQGTGKELEELLSGDRKPKLDLMRTCVAAIPRLVPEGMTRLELIDLLARTTMHVDDELRGLAGQTLQNLISECPDWRADVVHGFLQFISRDIQDAYPHLLENALRLLLQLMGAWKSVALAKRNEEACSNVEQQLVDPTKQPQQMQHSSPANAGRLRACTAAAGGHDLAIVLHCVEGVALVMLCQEAAPVKSTSTRKLAITILKEIRHLLPLLCDEDHERPVLDVLDSATPYVIQKYIQCVSSSEKGTWLNLPHLDFIWTYDKVVTLDNSAGLINRERANEYFQWDAWAVLLSGYTEPQFLLLQCPTASSYAWPVVYTRLNACFTYVDPNNPQNETRGSLLRSSKSKSSALTFCGETLNYQNYLSLWQKYLVLACALAPPSIALSTSALRSLSPIGGSLCENADAQTVTSTASSMLSRGTGNASADLRLTRVANVSASTLFKWVVPLLRCEMTDMRDIVVLGLGSVNPTSYDCLIDELTPLLRDTGDKKGEKVTRRRRRDKLRLQLIRLFELIAFRGTLSLTSAVDVHTGSFKPLLLEFIQNAHSFLESDVDRDPVDFASLRIHFAKMITLFVHAFSPDRRHNLLPDDKKRHLFQLFTAWCSRLGLALDRKHSREHNFLNYAEQFAVTASCAILSCGPIFDVQRTIGDEGYLYGWLDALLSSTHEKVAVLIEETLTLMLDFNADTAQLLEWVIDRCYKTPSRVADKCFRSLASVFSQRDYPCDSTSMLVVTLMYSGYPISEMQQLAVQLLQVLDHRFLNDSSHEAIVPAGSTHSHSPGAAASSTNSAHLDVIANNTGHSTSPSTGGSPHSSTPTVCLGSTTAVAANSSAGQNVAAMGDQHDTLDIKSSQSSIAQHMAHIHPELTMHMFSEITQRVDIAKSSRRASLLRLLVPWLHNIELVDPNLDVSTAATLPRVSMISLSLSAKVAESQAAARRVLKGEGWGSAPATEMVLNNLMYITVKFGDQHPTLMERLWCALVEFWPANLRVIVQYLCVMTTVAPDTLLRYAKQVIIYMAKANSERLVEELIGELQVIDTYRCLLERTEMAPYYRWLKKGEETGQMAVERAVEERQGTIHTRRHTPSDSEPTPPGALTSGGVASSVAANAGTLQANAQSEPAETLHEDATDDDYLGDTDTLNPSASMSSLTTIKADVLNRPHVGTIDEDDYGTVANVPRREWVQAFQLPMPPYGGWHAPLELYMPDASSCPSPLVPMYRSNLALLLCTDLVIADVDIDWTVHLPLLLQIATLGLDSSLRLIHDHCKQLLINLILVYSKAHVATRDLASVLLANNASMSQLCLATNSRNSTHEADDKFGTVDSQASTAIVCDSLASSVVDVSRCETPSVVLRSASPTGLPSGASAANLSQLQHRQKCQHRVLGCATPFRSLEELALTLVECLASKFGSVMWPCEEVTIRNWQIRSGAQLGCFVGHIAQLFSAFVPTARIDNRWAQTALHVALCSSNRHYAGRSFQIFRSLRTAPTCRMLSDVLSRLVETVSEQMDDMLQGYVTEILLTLDTAVVDMEAHEHYSTLDERAVLSGADTPEQQPLDAGPPANQQSQAKSSPTHARSTSYSSAPVRPRMSPAVDRRDVRNSAVIMGVASAEDALQHQFLPRSKSAQVLRSISECHDEHLTAMAQLLWIATSLLESDMEHEFILALRILDRLVCLPDVERTDILDRLERMVKQLGWNKFPGLLSLVLKGCVYHSAYETTVAVLSKLIDLLDHCVIDPELGAGLPSIVVSSLPLLLSAYDQPSSTAQQMADAVAEFCVEQLRIKREQESGTLASNASAGSQQSQPAVGEHPLEHLATMMRLYSRRAFSRDSVQWVRCVLKYLHDAGSSTSNPQLLVLLTEMLERLASVWHQPVLQIMYCLFQHIELQNAPPLTINGDVLRAVSKHLQGANWREAARIMKLTVTRGSILIAPSVNESGVVIGGSLPGRTMEFSLDMSSVIEELCRPNKDATVPDAGTLLPGGLLSATSSPKKQPLNTDPGSSSMGTTSTGATGSFKRYSQSQIRVREHLVSLLNASGGRVGLAKSPSVIFSQTSHDLANQEQANSVCSSSGELTSIGGAGDRATTPSPEACTDYTSDSFPRVFKEFDFLEAEHDSVSESADSCFNWMSTLRPRSISQTDGAAAGEAADRKTSRGSRDDSTVVGAGVAQTADNDAASTHQDSQATPLVPQDEQLAALAVSAQAPSRRVMTHSLPTQHEQDDDDDIDEPRSDEQSSDASDVDQEFQVEDEPEEHETASSFGGLEETEDSGDGRDMRRLFVATPTTARPDPPTMSSTPAPGPRPLTPASINASRLSMSTPSMEQLPPMAVSFALECTHHTSGQIDDAWNMSVHDLHSDHDGAATANATLVYTQLFRDCVAKVSTLLRDGCHFLNMSDTFRGTAGEFLQSLDVLMRISDCPFLFVTAKLLRTTNLLQLQKYALFELREHYETFLERREHCIRLLNCVKSSVKLQMMGQKVDGSLFDQKIDLCRALHKLYFQILMMSECFMKMVHQMTSRLSSDQIVQLGSDVLCLQRELLCAVNDMSAASGRLDGVDSQMPPVAVLLRFMHERNMKAAIQHLRYYRSQHGKSDLYGCCEEEDIEVLLLYYCRAMADTHSASFAVIGSEHAFTSACQSLMETNLTLSAVVRSLQPMRALQRCGQNTLNSSQPSIASSCS